MTMKSFLLSSLFVVVLSTMFTHEMQASSEDPRQQTPIDWNHAKWIGHTQEYRPQEWAGRNLTFNKPPADVHNWKPTPEELKSSYKKSFPSPLLRKTFQILKPVKSAKIKLSGLGLYELFMNGERVGNEVLQPAQTSYDKRTFYNMQEVTDLIKTGTNAIGVMLGNGFYGQNMAFRGGLYYGEPRLLLNLEIEYVDGTIETIVSDPSWKAHSGPILFDNIYHGETYDARLEVKNWSESICDDSDWLPVETMQAPTQNLIEQQLEPMRKVRKISPVAVWKAESGWIFDMGQNMTGWLQIRVNEARGTTISMKFAEILMPGSKNIDPTSTGIHVTGGVQTDIYICKGEGDEEWEPRFTYHGFRYVLIEGLSRKPELENYTGWMIRNDVERVGTFECSDPLINKFYTVSMWTIEDNLQGLLSDCPHRERCAWLGDAYVVAEAASYNFNLNRLWRKTADDMETVLGVSPAHFKDSFPYDSRAPSNIAVGKRLCLQARPDWGAATVMLPWYTYIYYGDLRIVENTWSMMQGWMDYLDEKVQQNGIIDGGYGDWCPPGGNAMMDTPPALTSTALYFQSLCAMHEMALVLGKNQAASSYAQKAKVVKLAFNERFFNTEDSSYGSQTGNAFALFSKLVTEEKAQAVADDLAQRIMTKNGGHYTCGIFGHRPLYTILNDFGHSDVTRHLWKTKDFPSLGFITEIHEFTTWPETQIKWQKGRRYERNSFNHPMNSGFSASFHESLGGIRPDSIHPGFKHFFLKPCFLPDLDWVKVTHRSPYGLISSSWKRADRVITWNVKVPENTTAEVQLLPFCATKIRLNGKNVANNIFVIEPGLHTVTIED